MLLSEISNYASQRAALGSGWLFVETAGGVHSPGPSGTTQADLYRPLRLPVILIGDSKLGGISQTISAFESLKIRGYDIEMVCLFREDTYQNHSYLTQYFTQHSIPVHTVEAPPLRADKLEVDMDNMKEYYQTICQHISWMEILAHLSSSHTTRLQQLSTMQAAAHSKIWYPFTQHTLLSPAQITVIDSARGSYFQTFSPSFYSSPSLSNQPKESSLEKSSEETTSDGQLLHATFDGSASWWTQGLPHGTPSLSLAAAYAAGRYGHVMFAEAIHSPALELAETLLSGMANPRLSRLFYSDNGSTGTEVAVKMALRATRIRYRYSLKEWKDVGLGVLGLKGGYHGDTMGAMDCAEPGVFNEKVEWYKGRGAWLDFPVVKCKDGVWFVVVDDDEGPGGVHEEGMRFRTLSDIFDLEMREKRGDAERYEVEIKAILQRLKNEGQRFGALLLEPVVLGAGGMLLV